eukprot:6178044-Pleurochrysis_carterae.AAC.4
MPRPSLIFRATVYKHLLEVINKHANCRRMRLAGVNEKETAIAILRLHTTVSIKELSPSQAGASAAISKRQVRGEVGKKWARWAPSAGGSLWKVEWLRAPEL